MTVASLVLALHPVVNNFLLECSSWEVKEEAKESETYCQNAEKDLSFAKCRQEQAMM